MLCRNTWHVVNNGVWNSPAPGYPGYPGYPTWRSLWSEVRRLRSQMLWPVRRSRKTILLLLLCLELLHTAHCTAHCALAAHCALHPGADLHVVLCNDCDHWLAALQSNVQIKVLPAVTAVIFTHHFSPDCQPRRAPRRCHPAWPGPDRPTNLLPDLKPYFSHATVCG